jgi:hypothetical protein
MSEPLTTYSERQIGMKRDFALYADRVIVKGENMRLMFETPVMLADLRPTSQKIWKRHWIFRLGLLIIFASIVPLILFVVVRLVNPRDSAAVVFLAIGSGLAIVGGTICLSARRRIEWTQYVNQYGTQILLDVARTGPEKDRYDEFIEALDLQILTAPRTLTIT